MSRTGRRFISVKYPVSNWMALASTIPMNTAPSAIHWGLPWSSAMAGSVMPFRSLKWSRRGT